jgi:cytochrome c553
MVRKILKITGMSLGGLAVLATGFYLVAYLSIRERLNRVYRVTPEFLQLPNDSASLKLGARLAIAKGCTGCHGMDLGGRTFIDAPRTLGLFVARNLTRGQHPLPGAYGSREWVLALKHGLRPDGTPLLVMPSHEFTHMTPQDMGAIVAYCAQMPPGTGNCPPARWDRWAPCSRTWTGCKPAPVRAT